MDSEPSNEPDFTGSILVAAPTLMDPHFRRSILILTRHEKTEGALGVILNRPCDSTLGDLTDSHDNLKNVPVFEGGPVEQHQLILARILLAGSEAQFESLDRKSLPDHPSLSDNNGFRAFVGYAGWSAGQLEEEIQENSWVIIPPTAYLLKPVHSKEEGISRWRGIMRELSPWHHLLSEAPDDLSLN
jgi:putative transcriptional regulator